MRKAKKREHKTTIQIDDQMRDEIKSIGAKNEIYHSILRRLLDTYYTGVRVLP